MVKVRQDAWSHEDDLLLAETVLRHIREGSTQLNAFEEVGDKLNRTSAACGFRWNAEIRMKYVNAIDLAKRQRKEKKRAMAKSGQTIRKPVVSLPQNHVQEEDTQQNDVPAVQADSSMTMDMVIRYLKDVKKQTISSNQSKANLEQVENENKKLREQVDTLNKELEQTKTQLSTIQEDYQAFIQIMERARKMTVLDDQGSMPAPAFRMDKNGNLQQLAQGSN
ncbi:MAG: RsfA family transcriptional regulator [Bacillota bacterium]|uniref:RsfA family transcriptional regulator n=1 Tax=Virgibacillus salarius TaxID=447199 RepID=A0A941E265_9BACI|nr:MULTISPECIES: RsfA family transcriptional regulator [Bacillaceae]NAZ10238.1 RsfA family transcriptional regulator [Agaribacter marinus]MBR7797528.1 RsfA family transcriptional regulator [Virgibacillus salarius]MCC2250267.1 RsfA family transcriptional regulator [Virgibacillus sp. AGTR]MDY7044632.1 RsfA family transcriptional regulator [Virgibacillus sp. M23]QRZ17526.1 RsfA family transcriptional regulator [Virgibacillus sp. AGTR]